MPRIQLRTVTLATAATLALAINVSVAPAGAQDDVSHSFNRVSTTPAYLNAGGAESTAVAEISTVSPDGNTLYYTDAEGGVVGILDITDAKQPKPLGQLEVGGEPTSVFAVKGHVLVVVDTSDGNYAQPSGHVFVFDATTRQEVRRIDLGGQPDSIDGIDGQVAIAIENERDEEAMNDLDTGEKGDLPQSPAGELVLISTVGDPSDWELTRVELTGLDGLDTPEDPEPEFVKYSPDGSKIALTLQENNAVAIIDSTTGKVISSWSAGTNDPIENLDLTKDGRIELTETLDPTPREPDAIGWIDDEHVATANEGDWKGGSRGWSIFTVDGQLAWDAGSSFEYKAIANGHWDEKRAGKKGTEPEGLAVATFGDTRYAFVGSERANFVAVYDVNEPSNPKYQGMVPTTNGPEGILPIPERNLLAVSSEVDEAPVRGTVALYEYGQAPWAYPMLTSSYAEGIPAPWLALGALAAGDEPGQLFAAPDNALLPNRILAIDATQHPALIEQELFITKDGQPTEYDIEGLYHDGDGFWLGVEGETGPENKLVRVEDLKVTQEITLPEDVTANLGKWGIEGVSGSGDKLFVALQRDADAAKPTRILEYTISSDQWRTFYYELEPTTEEGDWMGLSEIAVVSDDDEGTVRLGLIERDKLNGEQARIKQITEVTISPETKDGDTLDKKLAHDVLPDLQAVNGLTQEKLEGMTIDAAGDVFIVTDNDGLNKNTGETVFLNLGKVFDAAEPQQPASPAPSNPAPSSPAPSSPAPSSPAPSSPAPSGSASAKDPAPSGDPSSAPAGAKPKPGLPMTGI